MKTQYIKITDGAKRELGNAKITGDRLDFQPNLQNYSELKKLFLPLGISWDKKLKTHLIRPDTQDKIKDILGGEKIVDKKKTNQSFYTPENLAAQVVSLAEVSGQTVLETSAGGGALVKECFAQGAAEVICVEIDKEVAQNLANLNYKVEHADFLTLNPKGFGLFSRICQNPPFSRNDWVKFLNHSWKFLKDGGKMVSICPNAPHNKQFQKFIDGKRYKINEVEEGAFKEAGTLIKTMILEVWKD